MARGQRFGVCRLRPDTDASRHQLHSRTLGFSAVVAHRQKLVLNCKLPCFCHLGGLVLLSIQKPSIHNKL